MTRVRTATVALGVLACLGCGMYERGKLQGVSEEVVDTRAVKRPSSRTRIEVQQDGVQLHAWALSRCKRVEQRKVERTRRYDRKSTAGWMPYLGVVGAVLAGTGGYAIATADERPIDPPEHSDEISQKGARGYGIAAAAAGGLMATTALIHLAVVSADDHETQTHVEDGPVARRNVACRSPEPRAGVALSLRTERGQVGLGETGQDGRLIASLTGAVPKTSLRGSHWDRTASVHANGRRVGSVKLAPVRQRDRATLWGKADLSACTEPEEPEDCRGVERYLEAYPNGPHAARARQVLEGARKTLERLEQEEAARRRAEQRRQRRLRERRAVAGQREQLPRPNGREAPTRRQRQRDRRWHDRLQKRWKELQRQRARRAREAERRAARKACRDKCVQGCSGNTECIRACVEEQCE